MKALSCTAIALTLVAACAAPVVPVTPTPPDDSVSDTTDPSDIESGATYVLVAVDEVPFAPRATLVFGPGDAVGGMGPCNRWSADLLSTLPDFQIGGIVATEMACDDLVAEMTFFRSLALMSQVTFLDGYIVLTGYQGSTLTFEQEP